MNGHIGFEEFELATLIGVYEEERECARSVFIDLKMELDLARSIASDDLSETIDYGKVMEYLREECRKKSFYLIESLASSICDDVLKAFSVKSVFVRVKKPIDGYPVKWAICELARNRKT